MAISRVTQRNRILKALTQCLESKEYMEIRNALHVLTRIVDVFPVTSTGP